MKKIHFNQLNFRNNKAQFILLVLCGIILVLNVFEVINFENKLWNKLLNASIFLMLVLIYSKMFWFRNFVQWNKKVILIKLNNFWGKSYKFEEIKDFSVKIKCLKFIITMAICMNSILKI